VEVRPTHGPRTTWQPDASRTVVARNTSPDVPFDASVNPYRGCEHGCAYCYARPTHEFLGLSAGLDFESRLFVKTQAPELLRAELARPGWKVQPIALSGVTDPYQPLERELGLTRRCLQVLAEFRNPVAIVTKSHLVTRDLDVLRELAAHGLVRVALSVTTLRARLARALEPRAPGPSRRLHAVHVLAEAGIPTGVLVAPVIPGLTDAEIPALLSAAASAGACFAGHALLRLPTSVQDLFVDWLERHAPERKDKVLACVRAMRGGALDDARFGSRMRGEGPYATHVHDLFRLARRRAGLPAQAPGLRTDAFRRRDPQLKLFG
jgi:DNA repair photolyase